jgi:hypothetical protein
MWLLFAVIGLVLGQISGGLGGAVLGGLLGYALPRLDRVEARLRAVDARLRALEVRPTAHIEPAPATCEAPPATLVNPAPAEMATVVEPVTIPRPIPQSAPRPAAPPPAPWSSGLITRLLSGNILAKLGMVLLFFGIASALKLAAEHGVFPPYLRLLAAALAGLLSIWAGAARPAASRSGRPGYSASRRSRSRRVPGSASPWKAAVSASSTSPPISRWNTTATSARPPPSCCSPDWACLV